MGVVSVLERQSTHGERLRSGAAALLELFGLCALGWVLGMTLLEAASDASFLALMLIAVAGSCLVMWIRWRSWPAALYRLGVAVIVLAVAAPLLRHFWQ